MTDDTHTDSGSRRTGMTDSELQKWLSQFPDRVGRSLLLGNLYIEFDIDLGCGVFPVQYHIAWSIYDGVRYEIPLQRFAMPYFIVYAGYLGIAKMLFVYTRTDN